MALGAPGAARDVTADEKATFVGLKGDVEAKAGQTFETFEPVSVMTQTVAGTNYFVKVSTGGDNSVHVRAHLAPGATAPAISAVQLKTSGDALEYFEPQA